METLSAKVPKPVMDRIEAYADEIGESRSVAARELIRAGLDADDTDAIVVTRPAAFSLLGWLLIVAAWVDASDTAGLAGAVILAGAVLYGIAQSRGILD